MAPPPAASASNAKTATNLLGDFGAAPGTSVAPPPSSQMLNPSKPPAQPSLADDLVNNLLEGLDVNSSVKGRQQAAGTGSKPNYNSSFFAPAANKAAAPAASTNNGTTVRGKVTQDTFNDLLGGFAPSASSGATGGNCGGKTIGEMKKAEEMKTMTADEARVFKWKDGKARNLRALLCSLDTVLWEQTKWTKCGMHQLVTPLDVKKMYRKACLAVHPDKQVGTENEELSKLIFMELNDAWSDFDKGS